MRMFGDWSKLSQIDFLDDTYAVTLKPHASTTFTVARVFSLPNEDADAELAGIASTQALTNKTIVAASNTITTAASGDLTSTELNAALAEIQTDITNHKANNGSDHSFIDQDVTSGSGPSFTSASLTTPSIDSPVMTTPQINDASSSHQFIFAAGEIIADRTITLPVLLANDTFVFEDHEQILSNKTFSLPLKINDTSATHQYNFAVNELAADRIVTLPLLTGNDEFVFKDHAVTLTQKSIDSDNNTITNIANADIKAGAAIARSKLASGTADYVVINSGTGAFSEEQYLDRTRGGTGITSTATFPASGTIVTRDSTDTLTNKSIDQDGAGNSITNIANASIKAAAAIAVNKLAAQTAGYPAIYDGSGFLTSEQYLDKTRGGTGITSTATFPSSGVIVTEAATQTFTNKTLQESTIDNFAVFNHESTPASAAASTIRVYAKNDDKLYKINEAGTEQEIGSGGGGSAGINYIDNFDFEDTADGVLPSGWVAYADAAANSPVDGVGGSPNADWTMLGETTNPTIGDTMAVLTKTANDRRGSGYAYAFTIDDQFADNPELFQVEFYYNVESGTFDYGDFTNPSGDPSELSVWIISDPSGTPVVKELDNFVLDGSGRFVGSFQPDAGVTSYSVCLHLGTTTAVAWTMAIDNFKVGPASVGQYSRPVVARAYRNAALNIGASALVVFDTATKDTHGAFDVSTGYFTAPVSGIYHVAAMMATTVVPTAATETFSLQIRVNDAIVTADNNRPTLNSNATYRNISDNVSLDAGDTVSLYCSGNVGGGNFALDVGSSSRNYISISQISGPAQVEEGRVVVGRAKQGTGESLADATYTFIEFDVETDTHSAFTVGNTGTTAATDGTTFTAPVSGYYRVSSHLRIAPVAWSVGEIIALYLYSDKSGSFALHSTLDSDETQANGTYYKSVTGTDIVQLNAGESIKIAIYQGSGGVITLFANDAENYFSVNRVTGPAAVSGSETVACAVKSSAGQTIAGTNTLNLATVSVDTHGAWDGTNLFTAPVSGIYNIHAAILASSNVDWAAGDTLYITIKKNASAVIASSPIWEQHIVNDDDSQASYVGVQVSHLAKLNAGDTINFDVSEGMVAGTVDLIANDDFVYASIHKI